MMRRHGVDLVLDVGANIGEFGTELRRFGYDGRIVSMEPLPGPFRQLSAASAGDSLWTCLPYAIGAERASVEMNVAANRGQSSSILPMLPAHRAAAPDAVYVGVEVVEQFPLDELRAEVAVDGRRVYLKADVQGYEGKVLEGATHLLKESVVGLQLEVSFVPLYEGGMTFPDALAAAEALGLGLVDVEPVFVDPDSNEWLQADLVFFRRAL
jgi:FkbM family methyltransferase